MKKLNNFYSFNHPSYPISHPDSKIWINHILIPLHTSVSSYEQWLHIWSYQSCTYELSLAPTDHQDLGPLTMSKWKATPVCHHRFIRKLLKIIKRNKYSEDQNQTLEIVSAGLHCSLRISKHMLPLLLMFGWNTFVLNATWKSNSTNFNLSSTRT